MMKYTCENPNCEDNNVPLYEVVLTSDYENERCIWCEGCLDRNNDMVREHTLIKPRKAKFKNGTRVIVSGEDKNNYIGKGSIGVIISGPEDAHPISQHIEYDIIYTSDGKEYFNREKGTGSLEYNGTFWTTMDRLSLFEQKWRELL